MAVNRNMEVKIIPKPEDISWQEITDLLHAGYAEKAERGMNYLATYQDAETTQKRVGNGICFVALINEKLVGTGTLHIKSKKKSNRKWYDGNQTGYCTQLAVLPEYKGYGIGSQLLKKRIEACKERNADEIILDTSIHAKELLRWWKKLGFQYVELLSHPTTNYYSIKFRKSLNGKEFNPIYVKLKFYKSAIKCFLILNQNGKIRKIWKIIGKY